MVLGVGGLASCDSNEVSLDVNSLLLRLNLRFHVTLL